MGLLLLIPGLILQLNQTTWFKGEDPVGITLIVIGAILLLVQLIAMLAVGWGAKRQWDRF